MLGKFFGGGSAPDRLGGTFHVTGSFTNIGGLQPGADAEPVVVERGGPAQQVRGRAPQAAVAP